MKLLCLNVAVFEKNNDKIGSFIRKHNPDLICLQEVSRAIDEEVDKDYISIEAIKFATRKLSFSFFAPIWITSGFVTHRFHNEEIFRFNFGGRLEMGQYCKSKYPIIFGENVFVQNHFSYVTDWTEWPKVDYRAVQVVDLQLPNSKLRLLNYHGIWSRDKKGSSKTSEACKTINALVQEVSYPSVICGDFNLFPDTESMGVFDRHINLVNTYKVKSTRPITNELNKAKRNVVDYILVSERIRVKKFEVLAENVSDHLPLILEFEVAKN